MNILKRNAMLGVLAVMFCVMTIAQSVAQPSYQQAKDSISEQYFIDMEDCAHWQGTPQQVCHVQASGKASQAMALWIETYQPSYTARYQIQVTMANVAYANAIQLCQATALQAECLQSAKAARSAAIKQAKLRLKTAKMRFNARKWMA